MIFDQVRNWVAGCVEYPDLPFTEEAQVSLKTLKVQGKESEGGLCRRRRFVERSKVVRCVPLKVLRLDAQPTSWQCDLLFHQLGHEKRALAIVILVGGAYSPCDSALYLLLR